MSKHIEWEARDDNVVFMIYNSPGWSAQEHIQAVESILEFIHDSGKPYTIISDLTANGNYYPKDISVFSLGRTTISKAQAHDVVHWYMVSGNNALVKVMTNAFIKITNIGGKIDLKTTNSVEEAYQLMAAAKRG